MNLIEEITTDPQMVKRFLLPLKEDTAFKIPGHFEEEFKSLRSLSSSDKAVFVSKVTSPENYQTQIKLLAVLQHTLDRVQELNSDLYFLQMRWHNHLKEATTWINRQYFVQLNDLRDGVRKAVISSALSQIESGCEHIDALIAVGEKIYSHLIATNWNLKEGSSLIKEYLTTLSSPMRSSL